MKALVDDVAEVLRIALGLDLPALDLSTGRWGPLNEIPSFRSSATLPPVIVPGIEH